MSLTPESTLAIGVGLVLLYGYVCRVAKVNWWDNRPLPVLFHLLGGGQVIWLLWLAGTTGSLGPGWVGMAFSGVWLVWSYATWHEHAPEHTQTRRASQVADKARARYPA